MVDTKKHTLVSAYVHDQTRSEVQTQHAGLSASRVRRPSPGVKVKEIQRPRHSRKPR